MKKDKFEKFISPKKGILFILFFKILFLYSCTPKTLETQLEATNFPGCFEGKINSPRGSNYTNYITVDMASKTIKVRVDSYAFPSFAENKPQCNMMKLPLSATSSFINAYMTYSYETNEPKNPCREFDLGAEPIFSLLTHDWLGYDNQFDIWDLSYPYQPYVSDVFLIYNISDVKTAWTHEGTTKGWDGVLKADFSHILMFSGAVSPPVEVTGEAVWERLLIIGYFNAEADGLISADNLRAIAQFPRAYNYFKKLSLYLQFYQPGPNSGMPQVLKGDYAFEAKMSYETYKNTSSLNINPKLFKATSAQNHPTYNSTCTDFCYDENAPGNNSYSKPIWDQVPSIRGTTQGLSVCR